ncbi:MAG: dihydrolipoyl dehydrogenase [Paracoccaceae bacterium]
MSKYDVIVIGGGPGGYVASIRCAQLGLHTACVEGREALGGTCLNVGCIPSKALLHASHQLHEAQHNFEKMGLIAKPPSIDWAKMQNYKNETIDANTKGIEFLFKKNKIDHLKGWASIPAPGKVQIDDKIFETENIIIASGSEPSTIPNVEVDEKVIVSSTGALSLSKIPKTMTVIGAGVIGLELGSVYARLGTKVTIIEYLDYITPGMDKEVQKTFLRILKKQGISFVMGAAVQSASKSKSVGTVKYKLNKDDSLHELEGDTILVATGRKPNTNGLGLSKLNMELTERGQIKTDSGWQTNIPSIYAIGDVVEGPMLAHKAEDEGMAVAEQIAGKNGHVNYQVIPSVIYTAPEVASVGLTEQQAKDSDRSIKIGKFMFMGNGRAKANFAADGFVKILADKNSDRILGAHIIGPAAGDLIHELCIAMEFGASAQDVALTCHAHPTYSEAVREAALACGSGAIHA